MNKTTITLKYRYDFRVRIEEIILFECKVLFAGNFVMPR